MSKHDATALAAALRSVPNWTDDDWRRAAVNIRENAIFADILRRLVAGRYEDVFGRMEPNGHLSPTNGLWLDHAVISLSDTEADAIRRILTQE